MSPAADNHPFPKARLRFTADVAALLPQLRERFVTLDCDADTSAFLARAAEGRHGAWRTFLHRTLRHFMSDFDVNGLLDMYPLHLASTAHWQRLLGSERARCLLDVGAGSGQVTRTLVPCAERAVATERSAPMARELRRVGIECHELDLAERDLPNDDRFDLIACLNVLDRAPRPRRLLARLCELLEPGGKLVLALALPYDPFYYVGARTPPPLERLACPDPKWERAVNQLVERELETLGLEVLCVARAPYLSFGDTRRGLYELDDAVLVLRAKSAG